jgi:hypothetical protein
MKTPTTIWDDAIVGPGVGGYPLAIRAASNCPASEANAN